MSKRLAKLEDRLGVRLLHRTTRRVSLTGEGEGYLTSAIRILRDIEELEGSIATARENPKGLLRVNATFGLGREHVAGVVSAFAHLYPDLEVQLVSGTLSSNVGEIALKWVLDGHGITLRSEWDIAHHVSEDRLRLVLPRYAHADADIYAVYPERHNLSAKVRLFVDFLAKQLRERSAGERPLRPS